MSKANRPVIPSGTLIGDYLVDRILGQGGFGDVYLVTQRDPPFGVFALKTEYLDAEKKGMENEIHILRGLKSPYVPKVEAVGTERNCNYFVMELFGPSLGSLRVRQPEKRFPLEIVMLIAEETLKIIETVHEQGVVHRDIKPSNFMLRPHSAAPLCLIDFGISKVHLDKKTRRPVEPVGGRFIGTSKYASPAAFRKEELGRKDDLWSWFYMCCELSGMRLPWTNNRDKETVLEMKEQTPAWQLCENLPGSFVDIIGYIKTLKYEDKPDYKKIRGMLRQGCDDNDVQFEGTEWKWLWDRDPDACSLVPRKPGDEKYDTFDPRAMEEPSEKGGKTGCCEVA